MGVAPSPVSGDRLLKRSELAQMLRITVRTITKYDGHGLTPIHVSPRVTLYSAREAVTFLRDRRRRNENS